MMQTDRQTHIHPHIPTPSPPVTRASSIITSVVTLVIVIIVFLLRVVIDDVVIWVLHIALVALLLAFHHLDEVQLRQVLVTILLAVLFSEIGMTVSGEFQDFAQF